MIGNPTILLPAYGRSYQTAEEAEQDWKDGKDFFDAVHKTYCSIRDFGILDHAVILFGSRGNDYKQVSVFGAWK